jgi:hypothetical protein
MSGATITIGDEERADGYTDRPMCPRFIPARARFALRHFLVGLCVIAHLAATVGFPLPQPTEIEAGSQPFPCQHHHCGCRSADHCWRSCCCMSTQEKLAWAEKNGVSPPEYVLAAAKAEAAEAVAAAESETPSCCSHVAVKRSSCCAATHADTPKQCCSAATEKKAKRSTGRVAWVLGIHAQKCQGISTQWIILGAVLPPPPPQQAPVDSAPPLWWSDSTVCQWQTVSKQPDVPPPQCA